MRRIVFLVAWGMAGALAAADNTTSQVVVDQKTSAKLFKLLVRYAGQEMAIAEQLKDWVYSDEPPAEIAAEVLAERARLFEPLDAYNTGTNKDLYWEKKQQAKLALQAFSDQKLVELMNSWSTAQDKQVDLLLDTIFELSQPHERDIRRIKRKQKRLDTAMNVLSKGIKEFDRSDHRLSSRLDRIKDFRLERIAMLMATLSDHVDPQH